MDESAYSRACQNPKTDQKTALQNKMLSWSKEKFLLQNSHFSMKLIEGMFKLTKPMLKLFFDKCFAKIRKITEI